MADIEQIFHNTKSVYENQAEHWESLRTQTLFEKPFLDMFASTLPKGASLLDLGCGSGQPIAQYFLDQGFCVTGIDYAAPMISLAKQKCPEGVWHIQDIKNISLTEKFDGIYSWHGFFHLSVAEQKEALPKISQLVKKGGCLMLTVGHGEGEVTGRIGDHTVYHASLAPDDYVKRLTTLGFENVKYIPQGIKDVGPHLILATHKT